MGYIRLDYKARMSLNMQRTFSTFLIGSVNADEKGKGSRNKKETSCSHTRLFTISPHQASQPIDANQADLYKMDQIFHTEKGTSRCSIAYPACQLGRPYPKTWNGPPVSLSLSRHNCYCTREFRRTEQYLLILEKERALFFAGVTSIRI